MSVTKIRLLRSHQGFSDLREFERREILIGRPGKAETLDFDLSPDLSVSRLHAKLTVEDGECWVEDLNSARGTLLNGEEIKGLGRKRVGIGDRITLGRTTLSRLGPSDEVPPPDEPPANAGTGPASDPSSSIDAGQPAFSPPESTASRNLRRLTLFYELPLELGRETRLDSLLKIIIERTVEAIPGASRGSLLVKDRATGRLALKAHVPVGQPSVSINLAQDAMTNRRAFIYPRSSEPIGAFSVAVDAQPKSVIGHGILSAMYAPLMWQDQVLGVLCVDNHESWFAFRGDDLRVLQAVAHHSAMAVAQRYIQDDLSRHSELTGRLFKSRFPPRVRDTLMQSAGAGTLTIGTRQSSITVLIADIRGFTQMTQRIGAQRMSDLLNDYFPPLVDAVFKHNGTIDRFAGDSIFAVFGTPEPDENQHENAVRAALDMQDVVRSLSASRSARGLETCALGIGLDCGEALHGFVGNAERMEFTVIGDTANRASRYCNGAAGGEIVISPDLHQWVWNTIEAEQTSVETKHEGAFTAFRIKRLK